MSRARPDTPGQGQGPIPIPVQQRPGRRPWSAALVACLFSSAATAQSAWPQFRGPNGAGLAQGDTPLPAELDPQRNMLWRTAVGPGHSSPCISGERIFVTSAEDDRLATLCIDRETGAVLWRRSVEAHGRERTLHEVNSAASPSPVTDGERVIAYFGSYGLLCYDLGGELVWERPMPVPRNTFGTAASPVLAAGKLIFKNDRKEDSQLEAIDPLTGETLWCTERSGFGPGWSTPVLRQHDGVDELLVYGVWWFTAYDLADGSERWAFPGLTDEPCITPVVGEDLVFLTSYNMKTNPEVIGLPTFASLVDEYDGDGDGQLSFPEVRPNRSILSRMDADGEGDHPLAGFFRYLDEDRDGQLTVLEWDKMIAFLDAFRHANALIAVRPGDGAGRGAQVAWQHNRGVPECPSPLYADGCVYMVKNGGLLSCFEASTGKVHYQERLDSGGPYYASPVMGDGKVYAASARGVVTVVRAGPGFEVLARSDLGERIMATPALVDGRVFVRTGEHLCAFGRGD